MNMISFAAFCFVIASLFHKKVANSGKISAAVNMNNDEINGGELRAEKDPKTISGVMRAIKKIERDDDSVRLYNRMGESKIYVMQFHGVWQSIPPGEYRLFYRGDIMITRDISLIKNIRKINVQCDHVIDSQGIRPVPWYRRIARRLF